jgi:hypothetical protein
MAGVVQIAYSVADVEQAAVQYAQDLGAGPFFFRHHPPMECTYGDGRTGLFRHSSAYGQWGDLQLELVTVHDEQPAPGIHHVAIFAASLDHELSRFQARGWPLVMLAKTDRNMRFAFSDARPELGHLIESYEAEPGLLDHYARIRSASLGWDGSDPVRPMGDLPRLD